MKEKAFNRDMQDRFNAIISCIASAVAQQFDLISSFEIIQGCVERKQIRHFGDLLAFHYFKNISQKRGELLLLRVEQFFQQQNPEIVVKQYVSQHADSFSLNNSFAVKHLKTNTPYYYFITLCAQFLTKLSRIA